MIDHVIIRNEIPWNRIVHFYGRATDVPLWIERLTTKQHEEAIRKLVFWLEHQDGVSQATPVAVQKIADLIESGAIERNPLISIAFRKIRDSAERQMAAFPSSKEKIPDALWGIFDEARLWPPFVSDEEDEMLWEEWNPGREELYAWAALTVHQLNRVNA